MNQPMKAMAEKESKFLTFTLAQEEVALIDKAA